MHLYKNNHEEDLKLDIFKFFKLKLMKTATLPLTVDMYMLADRLYIL